MRIVGIDPAVKNLAVACYDSETKTFSTSLWILTDLNVNKTSTRDTCVAVRDAFKNLLEDLARYNPDLIIVEDQIKEKFRWVQHWLTFVFGEKVLWRRKFNVVDFIRNRTTDGPKIEKTGKDWKKNKEDALQFAIVMIPKELREKHTRLDYSNFNSGRTWSVTVVPGIDHNIADAFIYLLYGCLIKNIKIFQ